MDYNKNVLTYNATAEIALARHVARRSLWYFVNYAFGIRQFMLRHPHKNWLTERIHRPLCDWLQEHMEDWLQTRHLRSTPKKLMVIWPRGFGKTTLVTKAAQTWLHLQDPDLSTIIDSVTKEKSWEFLQAIKHVMDGSDPNAWFTALYGSWKDPRRIWQQDKLIHAHRHDIGAEATSIICSSVEKGITGKHPDALFIDDPIVQEKLVEGLAWLDKVNKHMDAMIPALQTDGLLVATATRYHDTDWLGTYLRDEGIIDCIGHQPEDIEALARGDQGQWHLFFLQARDAEGRSVLPEAVSDQWLLNYERKNPMDFQAQMMNCPGEGAHMPLTRAKIDQLIVDTKDIPKNLDYSIHCDIAWKDREAVGKGDYNVVQLWGHAVDGSGEVYYLEGYRSNTWNPSEFFEVLTSVVANVKHDGGHIRGITFDKPTGGMSTEELEQTFWNHFAEYKMVCPPVYPISRAGKAKETRIRWAAGYWNNNRVWLKRNAPGLEVLITEMLRIGVSAKDDMADAATDVFYEEIYAPEISGARFGQPPPPVRPMDEELQGPLHLMSDEAIREAYDRDVEKEQQAVYMHRLGWA